ncbi:aminotransferase class I/II-fold pyridoxal phosphate-dependent enzyme [Candidatus Saganbacteria bacterium]|uniref:Aminotransferase class I/II-fold pyridoxal phosphate-dependent enzyme n=1 Tax=Candidatus Saganbacteria bacterium TaxID=2575572 RepID=A0A9D6UKH1_UNCSA|nr:aminotransferase class I/II-fold pyridoxal phosphate-dependent enzyme [Candidatus Saganbacteria bacterium]
MEEAQRLAKLPTYVFALLDKLKAEQREKGKDLIDLSIGSPNVPPPPAVVAAMIEALHDPQNYRYPSFEGSPVFKKAVVEWCRHQYNLKIETSEVVELIGSKEGIIHLSFAFFNPGDTVLVPLPAYPAHFRGPILAGATPFVLPTIERNGFIPDLKNIDASIADRAKMLIISYPTNPTGACAPVEFFEEAVAFARKHKMILVHDFAYAELYFEGKKPVSCLSIPGAKEVCVEFHTLSKTFGMAGWRIGFAVGNTQIIESLRKIKTNIDYGVFPAVLSAAIVALGLRDGGADAYFEKTRQTYQKRRDIMVEGLNSLGWKLKKPMATMYIWAPVPSGFNSLSFTNHLLNKTGVVASPGTGFGDLGEGYIRISLVDKDSRLTEAVSRMKESGIKFNG